MIKLESPRRFDLYRTRGLEALRGRMDERTRIESSLYFHSLNRNKLGLALDLKQARGVEVLTALAARSDLLVENFTIGTMDRLGLGEEALWAANPRLCQLSMSGPGKGSAVEALRAYGLVLSALAGAETAIRDGDEFMGSPTFSLSDPNAAAFATVAALAGVLAARETGRGRAIDLSQIEAAAALAGSPSRSEGRGSIMVRADDGRDIALDLPREAEWRDLDGRPAARIEAVARARHGASAEVLALEATDTAPVFADCAGWIASSHPYTGKEMLVAAPWRTGGRRAGLRKTAPILGERDDYVLRRILAFDDDECRQLSADGVVGLGGPTVEETKAMIDILGHTPVAATLRDLIVLRAAHGDKPFLICRDEVLGYADADRLSNRTANRLSQYGIAKGDVVATLMYNYVEQALIWFACAKLGAIYASLNVSLAKDDLAYSLNDTGAKLLVVDEELAPALNAATPALDHGPRVFVKGDVASVEGGGAVPVEDLLEGAKTLPQADVQPTDPVAIVYTGGSTSMPKGVLVSHLYYIVAALRYGEIAEASEDDVHFANSHFFHIGGQQFAITSPLYWGMTGVMEKWFSASNYWKTARKHGATMIDPLGTMMAVLLRQPESELDRRHKVRVGVGIAAGQVRRDLRDLFEARFGTPMLEVYSMTEMGVLICSERPHDRKLGTCGRPHGWADIIAVDADDNSLPVNTTGQLLVRPKVPNTSMMRYINKPEETIAAWRNFWYHSGDLGYLDEEGYVHFVGREAHWIRRRGENVSAFEVEKAISAHPGVVDRAVVGVPSDVGEEDIKAYVHAVDPEAPPPPEELVAWCKERIAFFKVPRYVAIVEAFPRTMTKNEIARHELREWGIGRAWDSTVRDWIEG